MISSSINISDEIGKLSASWSPLELARCNDHSIILAKFEGEYPGGFHAHTYDELFLVHEGEIVIQMEDKSPLTLKTGDIGVVPKGVRHCHKSDGASFVLMVEPKAE